MIKLVQQGCDLPTVVGLVIEQVSDRKPNGMLAGVALGITVAHRFRQQLIRALFGPVHDHPVSRCFPCRRFTVTARGRR